MRLKTYLTIPLILCLLAMGLVDSNTQGAEAAAPEATAAEILSTRVYDLSFLPSKPTADYELLTCIPFLPYEPIIPGGVVDVGIFHPDREFVVEIIHSVIGLENLEHSGIFIELHLQGLVVKGPEAVHGIITEMLAFLRARLERTVELDIEIFAATGEGGLEVFDDDSVRRAFAGGRLWPVLKRSTTMRIGELLDISNVSETTVVWDNDGEIAQQSFVMEPIKDELVTGLRFSVRPFIAANGKDLLLSLYASASDLQEPLASRNLKYYGRLATDNAMLEIPAALEIDDMKISFASVAGQLSIESGKAAVVTTAFPHHAGTAGLVILLTPRLGSVPDRIDVENGWTIAAMDFSHLLADLVMPLNFLRVNRIDLDRLEWRGNEGCLTTQGPTERIFYSRLEEYLHSLLWEGSSIPRDWEDTDLHMTCLGNTVIMQSREVPIDEVRRYMGEIPTATDLPVRMKITCAAVDGPAILDDEAEILSRGDVLGATALPLKAGGTAAAYAGMEGIMVADYEVDVANNAAVPNPIMAVYVDGAHVHVAHVRDAYAGGSGTIRARVNLSVLKPPFRSRRLSEKGGLSGIIDQPAFDRAVIDARFACDGSPHLLGTLTGERDGRAVTIYVIGEAR